MVQEKKAGLNRLRVRSFADGGWREVAFPEPVYSASAVGTPEFDRAAPLRLPEPAHTLERLRLRHGGWGLDAAQARGGARGFEPGRDRSPNGLWARARDGTKVPISIVYPKGFVRDGKAPLWLYGYGSYGFGLTAASTVGA